PFGAGDDGGVHCDDPGCHRRTRPKDQEGRWTCFCGHEARDARSLRQHQNARHDGRRSATGAEGGTAGPQHVRHDHASTGRGTSRWSIPSEGLAGGSSDVRRSVVSSGTNLDEVVRNAELARR
ncbi:unnamed protein product, partial [Ectocarpus sp. 6 AP-2014]